MQKLGHLKVYVLNKYTIQNNWKMNRNYRIISNKSGILFDKSLNMYKL